MTETKISYLKLICRNETILLPINEFDNRDMNDDFFLKVLIDSYSHENNEIKIFEDMNHVMSIIESIRYNTLVILNNVSLNLLLVLAEKWCSPQWLLDKITEKKQLDDANINNLNSKDNIIQNFIFKCINCQRGFKKNENTNKSCKFHCNDLNSVNFRFRCCGREITEEHCCIGYHVASSESIRLLGEYMEKLS